MSMPQFLETIEEALGVSAGSLNASDRIADLEAWDSIGALSVIALLDERFGVSLDAGSLQKCETLENLAALIIKKD